MGMLEVEFQWVSSAVNLCLATKYIVNDGQTVGSGLFLKTSHSNHVVEAHD